MAIKADDFLAGLPEEERMAIAQQSTELLVEEATLLHLREARAHSQKELAEKLSVNQAAVSKPERRADMYLSTLRGFIEAMGGELEIVARFPDRVVRIDQFKTLGLGRGRTPSAKGRRRAKAPTKDPEGV